MTVPSPGATAAVASLAAVGVADVFVIAATGDSITAACRRNRWKTTITMAAFVAHLTGRPRALQPYDPFLFILALAKRVHRWDRDPCVAGDAATVTR